MPETIRALLVILVVGGSALALFQRLRPEFISLHEYKEWKVLWSAPLLAAFLSHNYWIFVFLLILIIKTLVKGDAASKFSTYMWMLFILPMLNRDIPGFAGINLIFELSYPRILSLTILLPLFISHFSAPRHGSLTHGDKLITSFLLVSFLISLRAPSLTSILRQNFYLFTDVFLPYFVACRSLKEFVDFKRVAFVVLIVGSIIASLAVFESIKHWHLFGSLHHALGTLDKVGSNQHREGLYRTVVSFSSPIVLGYLLTLSLGMYFAIQSSLRSKKIIIILVTLHLVGLISTVSRGPWVGGLVLFLIYITLTSSIINALKTYMLGGGVMLFFVLFSERGEKLYNLLPFVGSSSEKTVGYRQELFEKGWVVIKRNPFLGSDNYLQTPEMLSMIQGEGIIDIVNSYLRIALNSGLVGLFIFLSIFILLITHLYKTVVRLKLLDKEMYCFGVALMALMVSILVMIATVSSVDRISHVYWLMAGIISAFISLARKRSLKCVT